MKQSVRIAFCGIITALGAAIMLLAGVIPIATYALPAIAGALGIMMVVEMGIGWALPVYAATSIISALLVADKEAALIYILFGGYYPIIKALIERIPVKAAAYAVKLAIFNAAAIASFFLAVYLLQVPLETFTVFGVYLPWVLLLLGNGVFILYDFALSGLVVLYFRKFHPLFGKWFRK